MAKKVKIYDGFQNFEIVGETAKATKFLFAGSQEVWMADAMDWQIGTLDGKKTLFVYEKIVSDKRFDEYSIGKFVKNEAGQYVAHTPVPAPEFPGRRPNVTSPTAKERMVGRGYNRDGFYVSNNSIAAREANCHPATDIDRMFKFPAGFTAWAFECDEWHHCGGYYNEVIHYSADEIAKWINENPEVFKQAVKVFKEWKKSQK